MTVPVKPVKTNLAKAAVRLFLLGEVNKAKAVASRVDWDDISDELFDVLGSSKNPYSPHQIMIKSFAIAQFLKGNCSLVDIVQYS